MTLNFQGKSTLASILLRLADYDNGTVRINGVDLRSLDAAGYRARTTAVLQGFARFEASARENIGLGSTTRMRTPGAIERAAREAGAEKLLASLPRGLDTRLDSLAPSGAAMMMMDLPPPGYGMPDPRQGLSGGEVSDSSCLFSRTSFCRLKGA
jgi:ABC-type protease/lipase transport system fused ATPase/permease subunit